MMQKAFAYPFMHWVGMNTPPDTDPTAIAEFSKFYSTIHVPEVVANNPGFVRGTPMNSSSSTKVCDRRLTPSGNCQG